MEIRRNRIKIGKKEQKEYVNAVISAFENYDTIELSAAGEDKKMMSRIAYLFCNIGIVLIDKKTEMLKGTFKENDFFPLSILILQKPNIKPQIKTETGIQNG